MFRKRRVSKTEPYLFYEEDGLQLFCGDCSEFLAKHRPDVDVVVTAPPRGDAARHSDQIDTYESLIELTVPRVSELVQYVGRAAVVVSTESVFDFDRPVQTGSIVVPNGFGRQHEWGARSVYPVLFYGKPPNRIWTNRTALVSDDRPDRKVCGGHPNPTPDSWVRWLVHQITIQSDTVLDPFCGTGSVLRACKDVGIRVIGCDRSPKYCELSVERLRQESLFGRFASEQKHLFG